MTTRQFYVPGICAGKSQAYILDLQRRITLAQDRIGELQQETAMLKDTIGCRDEDVARLRSELGELNRCNDNQCKLIQTLREKSAVALLQRMRDDIEAAGAAQIKAGWSREHLLSALDTYERRFT